MNVSVMHSEVTWTRIHAGRDPLWQAAAKYRELADAKDRGDYGYSPQTQSLRIAVEAGIRIGQALGDWADWAKTTPPATPS